MNSRPPIPKGVKANVLRRARARCEDCGKRNRLELHHKRYFVDSLFGPVSVFGRETEDDLVALCRDCHKARHVDRDGVFWRDPEDREHQESWRDEVFSRAD